MISQSRALDMSDPTKLQFDPDRIAEAADTQDGNVQAMARTLDTSARTIYNYMNRFEHVAEAVEQARSSVYAEAVDNLVTAMRGETDGIDQQWATRQILETYGETVSDGLNWHPKERTKLEGGAGITIAPPETPDRIAPDDSEQLENGQLQQITDGDT